MKKLFLSIAIIAIAISSHAQDFAPLNAKWYFQNCCFYLDDPITYSVVETVSDTLIDGKYSTITHVYENNGEDFVSSIIIHEDQGRVYFFEQGEFRLFFDYNLNVGDTLTHRIPLNALDFQANCVSADFQEFDLDRSFQTVIHLVDTVYFDGIPLLQFWGGAAIPDNFDHSYNIWEIGQITQRLGGRSGLFGLGANTTGGDACDGEYRCYSDEQITVEFVNNIGCDYTTVSSVDLETKNIIKAYPNPTNQQLHIDLQEQHFSSLFLSDLSGRELIHKDINGANEVTLNLSDLPSGIYLLKLKNGQTTAFQKVVKY